MAGPRAFHLVRGKEAILHKIVFELRYHYGMTYLDRCGRTVNTIMREYPEWTLLSDQPSPQDAPLVSLANSCVFHFSARKLDLSLERRLGDDPISSEEVDRFTQQADSVAAIVVDQLGLKEFARIGLRVWYLFPCETRDEAERWLLDLGCYSIPAKTAETFRGTVDASSCAIVVAAEVRKFRIAITGVERQAQFDVAQGLLTVRVRDLHQKQREFLLDQERAKSKLHRSPENAAMIDVDAYQDNPIVLAPRDFIESSHRQSFEYLCAAVQEEH